MDALSLAAHVFLGTLAFGLGIGLDFVLVAVAKTRRPDVIRATYETVASYARWVGPLFLITVLIGFYEAAHHREALGAPWLLASYVLLVIGAAAGGAIGGRRTRRILAAARNSGGSMTAELESAVSSATPIVAWIMLVVMAAVIFLMIAKPGVTYV